MAAEVAARLVGLIATVSPGAKLGSTAPYGYAATLLVEAGDRQPRSLAEAFRQPTEEATVEAAEQALSSRLQAFDDNYRTGEDRRFLSLRNETGMPGAARGTLPDIMQWVRETLRGAA
jgi:CRISPR system Cascade subunit CasC